MNFLDTVNIILDLEAGYVNNPSDPGGETNYGIAKKYHPNIDIKNLTRIQAIEIYRNEYWTPLNLDIFPSSLRLIIFDCGVNQGLDKAKSFVCTALGLPRYDRATPTLFTMLTRNEIDQCILKVAYLRLESYNASKRWPIFGKGWMERLLHVSIKSALDD